MDILVYLRPDGFRSHSHHVAIIFSTHCSLVVAQKLQSLYPWVPSSLATRAVALCARAPAQDPRPGQAFQYAGALVVGLGCEGTDAICWPRRSASRASCRGDQDQRVRRDIKTIEKVRAFWRDCCSTPQWPNEAKFDLGISSWAPSAAGRRHLGPSLQPGHRRGGDRVIENVARTSRRGVGASGCGDILAERVSP